ncbi:MAG: dethiobiotin synthase [Desulfomonilaceae bacterium]
MGRKGLFITGTDTGVGKTLVAAGLTRLARKMGLNAVAVKPVETGCPVRNGELFPEDGRLLWEASERALTLDECAPFRFAFPAAPFRAAAVVGSRLFPKEICDHIYEIEKHADFTIVEGAGGLMVPIHEKRLMIDLMEDLGFPVLLVARSKLGTLNHTMLSVEALQRRGLPIEGVVISFSEPQSGPEEEFVVGDMRRLIPDVPVCAIPYLPQDDKDNPDRLAARIELTIPRDILRNWFRFTD